jgi:hypothetical protein
MEVMNELLPELHVKCPNCGWSTKQGLQDFLTDAEKWEV